jgi:hypothetical protein
VNFSVKQLIGENNLDFSDKMIGFSVFIPKNSPLGYPSITLRKGDKYVTIKMPVPVSENPYKFELSQGVWVDYLTNVPFSYYFPGANTMTNGTEADIMNIIRHVESFSIGSSRSTPGTATEAKFYVDDLNWIQSDLSKLPVDDSIDSLRKYAANKHFDFGLLTDNSTIFGAGLNNFVWQGDPWYTYTAVQEGSVNTLSHYFSPKQNEDYSNFDYDRPEDAKIIQ